MSGYPYGYPYQGQPPPPPPGPQQYASYTPYGAYPPPSNGFGTTPPQSQAQQQPLQQQQQHYAPTANNYHANAQSAYDYNATSIPGLGTPSAAAPPFPAPYTSAWNQNGYGSSPSQPPYAPYAPPAPPSSAPTTYSFPQAQVPVPQVPPTVTPTHATPSRMQSDSAPRPQPIKTQTTEQSRPQDSNDEAQEEGEIDDGYFDDLYDDASKAASVPQETGATLEKSSGDPVEDNLDQEPNFYDTDVEDVPPTQKLPGAVPGDKTRSNVKPQGQVDRDRSRSYSPHLSSTENGSTTNGNAQQATAVAAAESSSSSTSNIETRVQGGADAEGSSATATGPSPGSTSLTSYTSVTEASNEAKKAILRLLPHGVKYQTYIDEGFDPKLIKDLFTQLNLPTDSASSGPTEKPAATQEKGAELVGTQPAQQAQNENTDKKQEARKDKIARLMAEKKAKLAAASNNTGAAAVPKGLESSAIAVSTPPVKPPITRAEKDRLLQQKVEALRNKAREAKKLAQKPAPAQPSKPSAAQTPTPPQGPTMNAQSNMATQSASGTPLSSASQSALPSPVVSASSLLPRAPQINQRKRPVAADFMDYPPLPSKRPSLANRHNSSLVISISDDEDDDDDDIEMEVDSATEDSPAPLPQASHHTRRGPSIRDFPPLSNIKNTRPVHSPVNGSSTPGAKNANVDLETKERAILEMQRKIRELEAKKEAKAKSGNVTPRSPSASGNVLPEQPVQTPTRNVVTKPDADDKSTPSAQLLQEAEAASVSMPPLAIRSSETESEQRVRVPSAQASVKSAKALEKAERLRRMQEEMQKLQAEIEQEDDEVENEEQGTSDEAGAPARVVGTRATQESVASTQVEPERDAEVNETGSSSASVLEGGQTASNELSSDVQDMQIDSSPDSSSDSTNAVDPPHVTHSMGQTTTPAPAISDSSTLPDALAIPASQTNGQSAVVDLEDDLDDYEPPEPKIDPRIGIDSPSFSLAPAQVAQSTALRRGQGADIVREVFVGSPYPISPSLTHRKAGNDNAPTRQTTFAPYESPLRYYHAYRFHTKYHDDVPGGLKSLTYSNRIDPNKEMCPDEWEGIDCPRGNACQFQHFQSIIAPDSEIILELGSSDEFTGDQKRDFNNGLRQVVASFQKSKVRDFHTIAQAIVDFRHRFLGDPSKVLRLEGVNI